MNKQRRAELEKIKDLASDMHYRLVVVKNEEEEYRDNMPENLQNSEKYERADEIVSELEEALDQLEEIIDILERSRE